MQDQADTPSFAERLAALEAARAQARLASDALSLATGPNFPRRTRGGRAGPAAALRPGKGAAADPGVLLNSSEAVATYLTQALASGEAGFVAGALGFVARAHGMSDIAKATQLSRESLYRALKSTGNPEFATMLKVFQALGLRLTVEAAE